MNDLGRGYARIEAMRGARGEPVPGSTDANLPPPDKYNSVYLTLFVSGAAFLLPFNSFIMAVDFFQQNYPNSTIMFDLSSVYIASACVAVCLNNVVLDLFTYNNRITFGILLSLSTMIVVAVCNIGWEEFPKNMAYGVNLIAIGIVAFGCTIQQASYYGLTGCLPPRYTQAVMAGESAAGLWVSLDRILTKFEFGEPRRSTFMFFVFSILILLAHSMLHQLMMKHPLVLHYLRLTAEARGRRQRIQLRLNPSDDTNLIENEGEANFGVLKLQSPTAPLNPDEDAEFGVCYTNPVYSPNPSASTAATATATPATATGTPAGGVGSPPGGVGSPESGVATLVPRSSPPLSVSEPSASQSALQTPRPSYKVEDVVYDAPERRWNIFSYTVRWTVARTIYPYMVSIGLVYFTTLSLYPGIAAEVPSCRLGSWMAIVLMSTFNIFDLFGKIAAAWPYEWSRSQLLMASGLRLLLVPLFLLCASPRQSPHIVGDIYPILFSVALGFTNGLFGSVPMIIAPSRVAREHREIAGNLMTLSYNGGLFSGTMVSYTLNNMLGPPTASPCRFLYPTPPLPTIPHIVSTAASNITMLLSSVH